MQLLREYLYGLCRIKIFDIFSLLRFKKKCYNIKNNNMTKVNKIFVFLS